MTNLDTLRAISPEIAAHIEATYADNTTALLDVLSPHALAHTVADRWPGLGAAFYRLVAEAAREALTGHPRETAPVLPTVTPALSGLINGKDSSWF